MKKAALIFVLVLLVIGAGAFIFLLELKDVGCREVSSLSKDPILVRHLWRSSSKLITDSEPLQKASLSGVGLVNVPDIEGHLGIDWDSVGISLKYATVALEGQHVDYFKLDPLTVEEVWIGQGHRSHLVFRVGKAQPTIGETTYVDVRVECN